ncbi:MAG: hypothetical protein ACI93T_002090 [Porticoccaceae bacterium]|jgi:hypothetical protein
MTRRKLIVSHLAVAAISGVLAIWSWNLHLAAQSGGYTKNERRFLVAFDRSVCECEASRAIAHTGYAWEAALECTTPRAIRMVDQHCIRALSSPVGLGSHVAYSVLLDLNRPVLPESLERIKQMALALPEGSVERNSLESLVVKLEKKNRL